MKRTPARTKSNEVRAEICSVDDNPRTKIPTMEDKVSANFEAVLEENLEFWIRF